MGRLMTGMMKYSGIPCHLSCYNPLYFVHPPTLLLLLLPLAPMILLPHIIIIVTWPFWKYVFSLVDFHVHDWNVNESILVSIAEQEQYGDGHEAANIIKCAGNLDGKVSILLVATAAFLILSCGGLCQNFWKKSMKEGKNFINIPWFSTIIPPFVLLQLTSKPENRLAQPPPPPPSPPEHTHNTQTET